jgi:hypothetical protein
MPLIQLPGRCEAIDIGKMLQIGLARGKYEPYLHVLWQCIQVAVVEIGKRSVQSVLCDAGSISRRSSKSFIFSDFPDFPHAHPLNPFATM